jgi:alkanesulfonate monooxygenase SsuD/methylene tetrahydromethanopterin reductase-like flavin-dependent oxidoreductase (luciferase family)
LLAESELVVCADRNRFKYLWSAEHHTLTEYSHLAASDVWLGYLASQTEFIHLGAGIFHLSPRVNHPIRNAERAALLDHLTNRRFEFGTGRGAGSHELAAFGVKDPSSTRAEWDEVVWEIPRMWEREDYTFFGDSFTVDTPHNVLPKPYAPGHPAIWVACGNPGTYVKAGSLGLGALALGAGSLEAMKPLVAGYKEAIGECANPVGQFANDNFMTAGVGICAPTHEKAREIALRPERNYIISLVALYHDSFPRWEGMAIWPEQPPLLKPEDIDPMIEAGFMVCGSPDEVCEQLRRFEAAGVDEVSYAVPGPGMTQDESLEFLELFGKYVIPELDSDPVHSTTRYREQAVPKYGRFADAGSSPRA